MILSCGEALIDMLPRETLSGETGFVPYAGGSVFNTAIAIGRLGAKAGFFSGLSSDFLGQILRDTLEKSRVDTKFCAISDRSTTLAFVRLKNGQASYNFYDENTAGRLLNEAQLPELDDNVSALMFGGISLISEPCGSTYETLMLRESTNRVTMLDPNIRAAFITDKPKHLARMQRMIAVADIVKVSDEDIAWFGLGTDHAAIAQNWLAPAGQSGPKIIIITKGADGAEAYAACGKVSIGGEKVTVADTVGAGDTVNAGVLVNLEKQGLLNKQSLAAISQEQLSTAIAFGIKAAAITVSRAGANPPWDYEMK
ncbi:carbohydrate kinase [Pseudochrobactrum sp. sp1633]|uniref:carbohydrate kinase family protein n=1 Tax=Pseudochrobactrum sp. sp1633 TaxID=3036706 RepID=UPI0025A4E48C|nr:carbohydrate kinase [Pseudochrobactrum sp. sp1633]MDM8344266.1 carbohydrate kinase [Pseudochrobactrum sp. sp1633]HWD14601.1 carbohydrate kinase [Pseudochrobactrum sp.]